MKYAVLAAVAAVAMGAASAAHADTKPIARHAASPATSLSALMNEWNQAAFNSPSKPAQYRVYGRPGYATSGPGYNALVARIRAASADAQRSREDGETADLAHGKQAAGKG